MPNSRMSGAHLLNWLGRGRHGGWRALGACSEAVVEPRGVAREELQDQPHKPVCEGWQPDLAAAALLQALHQGPAGLQRQACW